jgi:hypothetical protein
MRPSDRSSTLGIAGQYDRLPSLMADLVRRHVAVIATPGSNPVSLAAKTATMQFQGEAGWLLGYPDKALASANDALILAERLNHPFSLGMTLFHASIFHQLRRDSDSSFQRPSRCRGFGGRLFRNVHHHRF